MLFLLDTSFETLATITEVSSVQWTTTYNEAGKFEIHVLPTARDAGQITSGKYVAYKGHHGIITYVTLTDTDIKIIGCDFTRILDWRICLPPAQPRGYVETLIKNAVAANLITPEDSRRTISFLSCGANQHRGKTITYDADGTKTVYQYVKELCDIAGYGFAVIIDENKDLIFDISERRNKTDIVFAKKMLNISEMEYTVNTSNTKNVAVYIEETAEIDENGEETTTSTIQIYDPDDKRETERREGSANKNATTAALDTFIDENKDVEEITATANQNVVYGIDYYVGDVVSVNYAAYGVSRTDNKRIKSVKEIWERDKQRTEITFIGKYES